MDSLRRDRELLLDHSADTRERHLGDDPNRRLRPNFLYLQRWLFIERRRRRDQPPVLPVFARERHHRHLVQRCVLVRRCAL